MSEKWMSQETAPFEPTLGRERTELRFVGLRRSGTHAVQNWLISRWKRGAAVCYLNDVTGKRSITPEVGSDDLPALRDRDRGAVGLGGGWDLLLYAMEDQRLQFLQRYEFPYPEKMLRASRRVTVLLLRDPFNTVASRLKIGRDRPDNGFFRDMFLRRGDGTAFFPELWKNYAREFLGELNCLGEGKVCINFNRWCREPVYRNEMALACGAGREQGADAAVGEVPGWGFGSSFDERAYHGRASEMDLENRWRLFEDDEEFRELTADPELRELSERIFGISGPEN